MTVVGEAKVVIRADTSKLFDDIQKQLSGLSKIGRSLGDDIALEIADGIESGLQNLGRDLDTTFRSEGKRAGEAFGDEFGKAAQSKIAAMSIDGSAFGRKLGQDVTQGFQDNLDLYPVIDAHLTTATVNADRHGRDIAKGIQSGIDAQGIDVDKHVSGGGGGGGGGMGGSGRRAGDSFGRGFSGALRKWMNQRTMAPFEGMIRGLIDNIIPLATMGNIIYTVVAAISSLVSALISLASYAAAATPALLTLGNAFFALAQGGIVASKVFKGVSQAIQATSNVQKAAKQSTEDLLERLLRIAQARLALRRAILQEARTQVDVVERITDAQEDYEDALRDEARAQDEIGKARDRARERLEDLVLALEGAGLSEERAVLNLKKAEKALAEARAGGNVNAIYEADLAYREQEFALRELREGNQDLAEEAAAAQAAGIDGAQEVLDAQEAYTDAIEATDDALRELRRSIEDMPLDLEDAALRVQQAWLNLVQALKPPNQNAIDALTDSMNELSPAAQRFVRYWTSKVQPILKSIRHRGQEKFFPQLIEAIDILLDSRFDEILGDMFENTADQLGKFTKQFAEAFTTPDSLEGLENIFESNIQLLETFGNIASTLVDPLIEIGEALAPIAEAQALRWLESAENFSEFINRVNSEGEGLTGFFERADQRLQNLWAMFKAFGKSIKLIFEAALPAGEYFVAQWTAMLDSYNNNFDPTKMAEMEAIFMRAADNALLMMQVLGELGGWFLRMGAEESVGIILAAVRDTIPELERLTAIGMDQIAEPLAYIIRTLPEIFAIFTETYTIEYFFKTLALTLGVIAEIFDFLLGNPVTRIILNIATGFFGAYLAVKLVIGVLGHLALKFTGVKGSFTNFKDAVLAGWDSIKKGARKVGDVIYASFKGLKNLIKPGSGPGYKETRRQQRTSNIAADFERDRIKEQEKLQDVGEKYGVDFTEGVKKGVKKNWPGVEDLTKKQVKELIEKIEREAGISSPSTKMIYVGEMMVEGLEQALRQGGPEVQAAGKQLGDDAVQGVRSGASIPEQRAVGEQAAEAFEGGLRQNVPEARAAGAALGESAQQGLDIGFSGGPEGKEQGLEFSSALRNTGVPQARAAGAAMGEAAQIGADTAFGGVQEGKEQGLEFAAGLRLAVPDAAAGGAALGVAAQTGADAAFRGGIGLDKNKKADSAGGAASKTAGKTGFKGALAKLGVKAAGKQAIGSFLPGIGNIIMGLWTLIDVIMLVVMFWPQISEGAKKAFEGLMQWWNSTVAPFFSGIWNGIKDGFNSVVDSVKNMWTSVKGAFSWILDWIKTKFTIKNVLLGIMGPLPKLLMNLFKKAFSALPDSVKAPVIKAYNTIADKINWAIDKFNNISIFGINLPNLPKLPILSYAEGGPVPGVYRGGDSVPAMLAPGEYVLTRSMVRQAGVPTLERWRRGASGTGASARAEADDDGGIVGTFKWGLRKLLEQLSRLVDKYGRDSKYGATMVSMMQWLTRKLGGGDLPGYASGGLVLGRHTGRDTQLARLTPGEYVLPRNLVRMIGLSNLNRMRRMGAHGGSLIQDIPLAEDWLQRELERLMKYFKETAKYSHLKISANENEFKEHLSAALELQLTHKKTAYDKAQEELRARKAQRELMQVRGIPALLPDTEDRNFLPVEYFETALSKTYVGPKVGTWAQILKARTGTSPEEAQAIATQLILTDSLEREMFAKYLEYLAKKAAEEAAAAAAAAAAQTDAGYNQDITNSSPSSAAPASSNPGYTTPQGVPVKKNGHYYDPNDLRLLIPPRQGRVHGYSGRRWGYPLSKHHRGHTFKGHRPVWSWDISSPMGIPVLAIQDGWIKQLGDKGDKSYGKYIFLDHDDGTRSVYAHLSYIDTRMYKAWRNKKKVWSGAWMGSSGFSGGVRPAGSRGAHLHFELWHPRGGRNNKLFGTNFNMEGRGIKMARGGIARATTGGISAILAEGGRDERVTPLDRQGRSSTEVEMLEILDRMAQRGEPSIVNHIHPSPGMNERDLASKVSRELMYINRRRS